MSNSVISLRMPASYHHGVQEAAKAENVSMNQWIASAVGEKLSALQAESYLEARAERASRERFEAALQNVPDIEPEEYDSLGNQSQ